MSYIDGNITIQPNTKIGHTFKFATCSTATAKGAIPYGRSISSATVTAYDADGTNVTTAIIDGTPSLAGDEISVVVKYPTAFGEGRYKFQFVLTLDNAWVAEIDFPGVFVKDN